MVDASGQQTRVMQFAKWPEQGRVKTRLMPALGGAGALDAHIELTLAVLDNLCATGYPVQFWWDREPEGSGANALPILENLQAAAIPTRIQQGEDLGQRMAYALGEAVSESGAGVIVGSDCPSVDADYVRRAITLLGDHDVVLGPSDDGGYVLIGARRVAPGMLDDIAWGTEAVLEQTCQRLKEKGLRFTLLEPRWDVDEPEDWQRWCACRD